MGEIARRARLSKQTMTTMVRLLERDGLVERRGDPADGRAALIFLTSRALAFRPVAETALADIDAVVAATLPPAGTAELRSGLRRLMDLHAR